MPSRSLPIGQRVYQLKVTLKHIRPPIWRRLQVLGDATLGHLHMVLQIAMGWSSDHLHEFEIGRSRYGVHDPEEEDAFWGTPAKDEDAVRLGEVVRSAKRTFLYTYDFGDTWEHVILVEQILPREEGGTYPVCLKGRRAGPPEDCGGPWGYGHLLEALGDASHPDHADLLEWVGGSFDPEAFDLEELNRRLSSPDSYTVWEEEEE